VVAIKVFFIDLAGLAGSALPDYRHRFETSPEDAAEKESES